MNRSRHLGSLFASVVAALGLLVTSAAAADHHKLRQHTQVGVASVYSHKFAGKKTASGKPFKPGKLTAASRNLPLNSKAKVTNLETGKSTDVTITDRGPFKKGRVIDLSPSAAKRIGVTEKKGVAPVAVKPIAPPPNPSAREEVADRPE